MKPEQAALKLELWAYREPGRTWLALADQNQVYGLDLSLDHIPRYTGNRYCARIIEVDSKLNAARIALTPDMVALLDFKRASKQENFAQGQLVAVEALSEPREQKGPKLRLLESSHSKNCDKPCILRDWSDPAKALFLTHKQHIGLIATNSANFMAQASAWNGGRKTNLLRADDERWQRFHDVIARARASELDCGADAMLRIEPVQTLCAFDINSRSNDAYSANMAAIKVIAQQIRLRNLAGLIVIDAIALPLAEQRTRFDQALTQALCAPWPLGAGMHTQDINAMDKRGVITMHRQRRGYALHEQDPAAQRALDALVLHMAQGDKLPLEPDFFQDLFKTRLKNAYEQALKAQTHL